MLAPYPNEKAHGASPPYPPQPQYDQQAQYNQYPQQGHPQQYAGSPQPQYQQQYQQEYHQQQPQQQPQEMYNKQPEPQQQMANTQQARGPGGEREWEHGMCDCFSDMGCCCMGYWCPCMVYSKIQHRIRHETMDGYSNCNGACVGWACLTYFGVQWIMSMIQRGDIRSKYGLAGSGCGDCSRHYWCGCCTLIQEDKETAARKAEQAANMGGYKQQSGMAYTPQH